jgi:hypothetical protein
VRRAGFTLPQPLPSKGEELGIPSSLVDPDSGPKGKTIFTPSPGKFGYDVGSFTKKLQEIL